MRARTTLPAIVLSLACVLLAACSESDDHADVVATTTQVGDLARHVAGDRARVRVLLRPGADPHEYEPRPSDARAIGEAKLVLRSGGEVDDWLGGLLDAAGGSARVVDLMDGVGPVRRGGQVDPHWWQDPRRAATAVEEIGRELARMDSENAGAYRAAAAAYAARLRRLDAAIARCVDRVPPAERKIVTSHDSLGYYADRYGIEIVGAVIPALTSQAQPSAGETARLVARIRSEHVNAVFPESALNPRLERAIARDTGARVGDSLWADSLGPAETNGATYIDAMVSNTEAIVDGMSGGTVSCRPYP